MNDAVFIDTSALLAVLDAADQWHPQAAQAWRTLLESGVPLLTSNYVLLECSALAQRRLGLAALRSVDEALTPVLTLRWVDEGLHRIGMGAVLVAGRRGLSLVDCISFEIMRRERLHQAFAFDRHFREQGYDLVAG